MRYIHRIIIINLITVILPVSFVYAQDPADILREMQDVMLGDSQYAEMTMKIVRPRYEREVSLRSWLLDRDYSMILITAPSRDEGRAFLMRKNNIWNYDPVIERTTRLPSSMMAQPWMGSDFTNDDLVRDSDIIDDYSHTILRTEDYGGHKCYVIEMIPKPGTPIVWGKVKTWITVDEKLQLRVENYDQRNELVNTMVFDNITRFGDRRIPARITVTPEDKENQKTVLTYHKVEFNIDINQDFFTQSNMQRLR